MHPVEIAAQRIDLAIVTDHPERLREIPTGESVGREALMNERHAGHQLAITEIEVVLANLPGEQHAFVNDGARRHGRYVELLPIHKLLRSYCMLDLFSDDEQLALESIDIPAISAAADKSLANGWLDFSGGITQPAVIDRNVAPAQKRLPLAVDEIGYQRFATSARFIIARQKNHSDPVIAGRRQRNTQAFTFAPHESIGDLQQYACAVTK